MRVGDMALHALDDQLARHRAAPAVLDHVEAGWETALEAVLRERLAALEVSNLDWVKAFATDAPPAKLAFYAPPAAGQPAPAAGALRSLLSLVRIEDAGIRAVLTDWLGLAFVADDLQQALSMRAQLPEGGAFVVKAGHVVTRVGVQLYAADSEQAGMPGASSRSRRGGCGVSMALSTGRAVADAEARGLAARTGRSSPKRRFAAGNVSSKLRAGRSRRSVRSP